MELGNADSSPQWFIDTLRTTSYPQSIVAGYGMHSNSPECCAIGALTKERYTAGFTKRLDPKETEDLLSLHFPAPGAAWPDLVAQMIEWNDEEELTFSQIADKLEGLL